MPKVVRWTLALCTLIMATCLTAAIYWLGLSGGLLFDDIPNLEGLTDVRDLSSAGAFVLAGEAGPVGRPIALASFVAQHAAWPEHPSHFLAVNLVIHLVNGLLVFALAHRLALSIPTLPDKNRALWLGVGTGAIWLCLPLLASSTLMPIQRMTTLASLFVIAGLVLHCHGRVLVDSQPRRALILLTGGALLGMGVGTLTKENAAVYALLVLVLDRSIFAHYAKPRHYRLWRLVFATLPALLIALYMGNRLLQGGGFEGRPFDMGERLLSQGIILVEYVHLTFVPYSTSFMPFHDNYPIYGGFPLIVAIASVVTWCALAVLALIYGPRYPLPSLAVLWYLAAHSIESTWLPLELYYEHRNYLPSVGLIAALSIGIGHVRGAWTRVAPLGVIAYASALGFSLLQVTMLWGQPRLAAEIWWQRAPTSDRATQFLAREYLSEHSGPVALGILDTAMGKQDEKSIILELQAMHLACSLQQGEEALRRYEAIADRAPYAAIRAQPGFPSELLDELMAAIETQRCTMLDARHVDRLAAAFRKNPAVNFSTSATASLYTVRARAMRFADRPLAAGEHLLTSLRLSPKAETADWAITLALHADDPELLSRIISELRALAESNETDDNIWARMLAEADEALSALSRDSGP